MRAGLLAVWLVLAFVGATRADDAILVLDASGSMWGQIDGQSKVEIARSVVDDLLTNIPTDRRLGLVAYGHRREGDCADIEEIVPVGTDRTAIRNAVNGLNFKGKTPLSAAVRLAADKLRYTDTKATVILVSDGVETCNADPCALGAELEAAGINFTVHVVGFGLASDTESAGLKCLAEATGGKYFAARNMSELAQALKQTVAAPVPAPVVADVASVTLRATELTGGPEVTSGLTWTVAPAGGAPVFTQSNAGVVEAELPPGDYEVSVVRAADGLKGQGNLSALAGAERTVTIALEFNLEAALTLTPTGEAPAGSKVSVQWSGPNRGGDYITVVKAGADPVEYLDYQTTERGNPLDIVMPVEPGDYEMRYMLGRPQRVLASVPLKVVAVSATLTVPPSAVAGSTTEIVWTGPSNPGDWITVVKSDAAATAYNDYFDAKPENHALTMPLEPGDYEVRYVQGGQKVIARAPITLTAAAADITAPATAVAGSTADIVWTGPSNPGDWITVVKGDAPATAYNDYFDAKPENHALTMPIEPGDYEVRYVQGGQKVIARAPITLTAAAAEVTAPASAAAGAEFEIIWSGPNYPGDWLTIVKPEQGDVEYGSYVNADSGSPAKLVAPVAGGLYEVRYVLKGKKVIARRAIEVTLP